MKFVQVDKSSLEAFLPLFTEDAKELFMTDPDVLAVGAVTEEYAACGLMLLKLTESYYMIMHLAVADAYRRQGIAGELVGKAEFAAETNDRGLLAVLAPEKEEDELMAFFEDRPQWSIQLTEEPEEEGGSYYLASYDFI